MRNDVLLTTTRDRLAPRISFNVYAQHVTSTAFAFFGISVARGLVFFDERNGIMTKHAVHG